ncbi:MAG: acyltransferase family protein [Janthinobacterium lividum]
MKYIKQLDSIRAIAVILVIISHWLPKSNWLNQATLNTNGAFGVNVFFVLSGFLITGILLENRREAEQLNLDKSAIIKNFFFRRALRIFPIYYLTITFLLIVHKYTGTQIRDSYLYFYTYTANIHFYKMQEWDGMLSHLWSLSVEEQFYLIWPWLIIFIKEKYLKPLIIAFIVFGVISDFIISDGPLDVVVTTSCFDAFGIGALLSWQLKYRPDSIKKYYSLICIGAFVSLILLVLIFNRHNVYVPYRVLCSGITVWIISYILVNNNKQNFVNYILSNKTLINLGKISYGLYLYHLIIIVFSWTVLGILEKRGFLHLPENYKFSIMLWSNAALLILISWFSWIYIEKPFLNLKNHFILDRTDTKSYAISNK